MFAFRQLETLQALVDRIIPPDDFPGGWEAEVGTYLFRQFERDLQAVLPLYRLGLDALDAEALAAHHHRFPDLPPAAQDELLSRIERADVQTLWPLDPAAFFRMAVDHVAEGYYTDPGNGGNQDGASWRMIGFEVTGMTQSYVVERYDAVVIGAGAGGGIAAGVLAEAGKSVLLLERGHDRSFEQIGRDHLRNQRLSQYGHNAGPDMDGNPRVFADISGEVLVQPNDGRYQANAAIVGGGTRVYGAQAWRFMPQDFRMAALYGVPEGSSLADWPITYDDLTPYYERAEWEIGVCGDSNQMKHLPAYQKPYPMPPMSPGLQGQTMRAGAAALGWATNPVPLLINSTEYNGRPACIRCQHCVGFACPVDAKNGTQNTLLARALATGNCTLVTGAMVERMLVSEAGRVTGVAYFDESGSRMEVSAEVVVVSAGAVESARLLINSASPCEPRGLGNNNDQVGRHLQGHYYPGAVGLFPHDVQDNLGPGVTTATCQFNHGNDGIIGGGMLADEFILLPIILWKRKLPPDVPRWGAANKAFMRANYRRIADINGPVQEIPSPDARVTLDPHVRDRFGIPVAHLAGTTHPETVRTAAFMHQRAREWLRASGAVKVWGNTPRLYLSGGQHQAGTCRMGDDPQTSVTDRWGRVHGHDNLFVIDSSVHVTNGGFNPVLTIMALAFRAADHLAQNW